MSIYELTKVESADHSSSGDNSTKNIYQAKPAVVEGAKKSSIKKQTEQSSNQNFSFALDFSPKREINKVSFASFNPDNDDDILETCDNTDCDNIGYDNEEDQPHNFPSNENLIQTSEDHSHWNQLSHKLDNSQSESIPKMQLNMFIQNDGKQTGTKKWPKVETSFCRQNKIAEVI